MVRKKRARKQKGKFWILVPALTVTVCSQVVLGRGVRAGVERGNVRLTLRVYNYATADSDLSYAEAEATVILNYAGLQPVWADCPVGDEDSKKYLSCEPNPGPTDFIITIVAKPVREQIKLDEDAAGQALKCSKSEGGCWAYVFYSAVREQAREGDIPEFRLLGHVLAHEIGHLLLGPNSHSATGIMMAGWSDEDLRTIARGCLFFTQQQARRMRDALLARGSADQLDQRRRQPGSGLGASLVAHRRQPH